MIECGNSDSHLINRIAFWDWKTIVYIIIGIIEHILNQAHL